MKRKITLDELKEVKPDFPDYFLDVALDVMNAAFEAISAAFEAISDDFDISKEDFLKVVASDWSAMYFIGKAWLAAREEKKPDLAWHSFYLFHMLLNNINVTSNK